jgi:hypothetical protein
MRSVALAGFSRAWQAAARASRWRTPAERDQAPALEDALDDRVGEVLLVQHLASGAQRLVRGEDRGAAAQVAGIDDVVEDVGRVGAVAQVADLVRDQYVRMGVDGERIARPALGAVLPSSQPVRNGRSGRERA